MYWRDEQDSKTTFNVFLSSSVDTSIFDIWCYALRRSQVSEFSVAKRRAVRHNKSNVTRAETSQRMNYSQDSSCIQRW